MLPRMAFPFRCASNLIKFIATTPKYMSSPILLRLVQSKNKKLSNIQFKGYSISIDSKETSAYGDKDPGPLFFNPEIQKILEKLTGFDLNKIFNKKNLEYPDAEEEYKFMTEEDLKEHMEESIKEGKRLLQMPPVIQVRKPINEVLSYDPALEGVIKNKMIFTDISAGVSDRERIIVVRDLDGTLRQANWDERHQMNQIYNPRPGRYLKLPELFQDEYLADCLDREEFIFILDFACAHFEPDDPLYHKVTSETYEYINMRSKHQVLESTRHYGPFCFYLAWRRKIDNLLIQYLHKERLEDCVNLIKLYYLLKTDGSSSTDIQEDNYVEYVVKYIEGEESPNKPNLQLALQTYQEAIREKTAVKATIESSHGL